MRRLRLLAMLVLSLTCAQAPAEVYKWFDAQGKTHYGDRPPGSGTESHSIDLPPAPTRDADHAQRSLMQRRLLEAIEAERAEQQQAEAEAAAAKRKNMQECDKAKRDLAAFERANIIYSKDEDGGRIYMSDEERRESLDRARIWVAKNCH
jgi:hypothetical protein